MSKELARNRRAYHDYTIYDEYEAGIVLTGGEVKSIKAGKINLKDSYIKEMNGELWLVNANIPQWKQDTVGEYDPDRRRKILLKKKEAEGLILKSAQQSYTILPLSIYTKASLIKVKIGLAKGKKEYEKKRKLMEEQKSNELKEDLRRAVNV